MHGGGNSCSSDDAPVRVASITLDRPALDLPIGASATLVASVLPDDAEDKTVAWSVSDPLVASVDAGVVRALALGKATVTASAGGMEATCLVTVIPVEASGVALDRNELDLSVGDTHTLVATVTPDNATDKTVAWSSSDETVATVADGLVTALSPGAATITASVGSKRAECRVTVAPIPVTAVALDATKLDLLVGDTHTLVATVTPDNATDKTVAWSSSDETVATVADGLVTALAPGTATITATAGSKTAECRVTVAAPGKVWAVGDYYDVEGVKGVVFQVSAGGTNGKIVSTDETVSLWATNASIVTQANSEEDGQANTQKIKDSGNVSLFPAFEWCIAHGEGWYMPAIDEMQEILRQKQIVNETLAAHGGTLLTDYYWSSTESVNNPDEMAFYAYGSGDKVASMGDNKAYPEDDTLVRATYAF